MARPQSVPIWSANEKWGFKIRADLELRGVSAPAPATPLRWDPPDFRAASPVPTHTAGDWRDGRPDGVTAACAPACGYNAERVVTAQALDLWRNSLLGYNGYAGLGNSTAKQKNRLRNFTQRL